MSGFIVCLECGENLGQYKDFIISYDLCEKMRNKNILDNFHPGKLEIIHNVIPDFSDLLDSLGLTKICCRTHLLSDADIYSYLSPRLYISRCI